MNLLFARFNTGRFFGGGVVLFWNLILVIAIYVIFLGTAYHVLSRTDLFVFVFLALLGVVWALADAADLAGAGKRRAAAIWGGFAAAVAVSGWFLACPLLFGN
ncbi:hypothetical protein SAMN02745218_01224 [Desulfofundulus australicus DSM 11792]|uniref:Uncharacterized protein n=2 Tax=Desulfofundulus australicus TaxID=1566 RepID=A0A1M4Y013_9FIRM|nr:hypothetical protein SAMN02745218_01224 [Desulfofundulus australicus DSM 11792]